MKTQHAFTLLELLITLSLASVLFFLAIPSGIHLINSNKATTKVNELVAAIHLGRTEAIKRGVTVTLCKSQDGQTCSGTWDDGQILIAGNTLLRTYPASSKKDHLTWQGFRSSDFIQFHSTGMGKAMSGHFVYTPNITTPHTTKTITISQAGRIAIS